MMKIRVCAVCLTLFSALPLAAEYQYYVSGYPAENNYCSATSSVATVAGSVCREPSAAGPLDARFRTWDWSTGYVDYLLKKFGFLLMVK